MSKPEHHSGGRDAAGQQGQGTPGDAASTAALGDYQAKFRDAPYYSTGREWSDYAPAYRLGHTACSREHCVRFEDFEPQLELEWMRTRAPSRLSWAEARGACEHAWRDCRAGEGAHVHETPPATPGRHGA